MALFRLIAVKSRLYAGHNHVARYDSAGLNVRLSSSEIGLNLVEGRQGRMFGLAAHYDMILGMAGVVIKDRLNLRPADDMGAFKRTGVAYPHAACTLVTLPSRGGTGGRPAELVRFRREVRLECAVSGTEPPLSRSA
jgi:hypothetical protein